MDVVGDDRVAAQGGVGEPDLVAEPAFDVLAQRRIGPGLPGDAEGGDVGQFSQPAFADAGGHLDAGRIVRQLVVDQEAALFLRGLLGGGPDGQAARHVDGDRLGHVDVQAGFDRGLGLFGIEVGHVLDERPPRRRSGCSFL